MGHCVSAAAEEILDREIKVLDRGFVRLVDYMGTDDRIVRAARVSYGEGTKTVSDDKSLIDHLLRNRHTSPFEQVILTFHVKLPIFVARQWIRHRTARVNEISGRYSVMRDECYLPEPADIAPQSRDNKQGRTEDAFPPDVAEGIRGRLATGQQRSYGEYKELVDGGLARELARINLPLSLYTEWYWQIDLHNLFNFISLRLDPHAQREIRAYAEVLLDMARRVAPWATESFENHVMGGVGFSAEELVALRKMLKEGAAIEDCGLAGRKLMRFRAKLEEGRQL